MAKGFLQSVKSIIFWEYDRGTWQYDVLAALIIILIFFSDRGHSRSWLHPPPSAVTATDAAPAERPGTDPPEMK